LLYDSFECCIFIQEIIMGFWVPRGLRVAYRLKLKRNVGEPEQPEAGGEADRSREGADRSRGEQKGAEGEQMGAEAEHGRARTERKRSKGDDKNSSGRATQQEIGQPKHHVAPSPRCLYIYI
jgi:hypothetical protein